jgi:hypothetical protein
MRDNPGVRKLKKYTIETGVNIKARLNKLLDTTYHLKLEALLFQEYHKPH